MLKCPWNFLVFFKKRFSCHKIGSLESQQEALATAVTQDLWHTEQVEWPQWTRKWSQNVPKRLSIRNIWPIAPKIISGNCELHVYNWIISFSHHAREVSVNINVNECKNKNIWSNNTLFRTQYIGHRIKNSTSKWFFICSNSNL